MAYTIDWDGPHILIALIDVVEPRDLMQLATETKRFERGDVVPHRITDLSRVEKLSISFEDVYELATLRKSLTFKNPFKSALVVTEPVQMGYARMFQTLNDHPQITLQIFQDLAAARAWLMEA